MSAFAKMRYAGFQEASGLAESPRAHFGYRSRQQENPGIAVRITPKSDLPSSRFDFRQTSLKAEGKKARDFGRFLTIALSSSSELEYHLILARDTNNMPENEFILLVGQTITVRKMLYALLKRVAESESTSLTGGNESDRSPEPPAKKPKAAGQNPKPPAAPPKAAGR